MVFGPQNARAAETLPPGIGKKRYTGSTWVRDASAPGKSDGTVLDAAFYNRIIGALEYILSQAGITAEPGDVGALYRAIVAVAPNSEKFADVARSGEYGDLKGVPVLGSAAGLSAGTAGNQLVQLDGTGALPAIDGSKLIGLNFGGRRDVASSTSVVLSDKGRLLVCTGTLTLTLTAANLLGASFFTALRNDGAGVVTVATGESIDGKASIKLFPGESCFIYSNGANFKTAGLSYGPIKIAQHAYNNETAYTFDGIFTDDFKKYVIRLDDLKFNPGATSISFVFRRGGASLQTTGYYQSGAFYTNYSGSGNAWNNANAAVLQLCAAIVPASSALSGEVHIANPTGTAATKRVHADIVLTNPDFARYVVGGQFKNDTAAVDGLSLGADSVGGVASGTLTVFGYR